MSPPAPEPEAAAPVMPAAPAAAGGPPPGPPPAPAMVAMPPKKKGRGLKVAIAVIAAIIILAVVVVVLILVIPNGNSKARDLINKAAKPMATVTTKGDTLSTDVNSLLQNIASVTSSADYEKQANQIRAEVKEVYSLLTEARTSLNQVSGLSAKQDYKTYAGIALDIIKADLALTAEINSYLDYLSQAFKDADAGKPISSEAVAARTSEFIAAVNKLSAEATTLKDKAEKFKTDHKL